MLTHNVKDFSHVLPQKFVKHGASPQGPCNMGPPPRDPQIDELADSAGEPVSIHHNPIFAEGSHVHGSDNSANMADYIEADAYAKSEDIAQPIAMHKESNTRSTCKAPHRAPCASSSPTAVEEIKEGMAQLLANYTWPWYRQNVQLFKTLYNIHLVDDITSGSQNG